MSKKKQSKATADDRLTKQQEKYVNYLIRGDSQRQAYMKAYPNSKKWKPSSVDAEASKMLAIPKVSTRHRELMQDVKDNLVKDTIATQQEALEFFTRLMRREEKEQVVASQSRKVVNYDEEGRRTEVSTRDPVIVDIDAKLSDAFKGAEAIAKYYNIFGSHDNAEELSKLDKLLKAMKDNANVD
jgi:hypothetical protein